MEKKTAQARPRRTTRILLLLFLASPLLLLFCLYLKQQELITERSHVPRIILTGLTVFMQIVTAVLLWVPVVEKALHYFKLQYDYSRKLSSGNILFGIGAMLFCIPLIITLKLYTDKSDNMETEALVKQGVIARKRITAYEYTGGSKRPHRDPYRYSFEVRSLRNRTYILSVYRPHYTLKPGDSIDVIYLPADPDIFHEIVYRSGKSHMIKYP